MVDALGAAAPAEPPEAPEPQSAGPAGRSFGDRRELAVVVVVVAVGGGLGVLATARAWSTVAVTRLAPLGPVQHDVTGRTLQPGVTGLAVMALAGVLAVLATRGVARRIIGAVLALAGVGMVGWSLTGLSAVSPARGRQLVADARTVSGLATASATDVTVHPAWVVLAALGGVLVAGGGVVTIARGGRWRAMSARYESPVGAHSVASARPTASDGAGDPAAGEVARARSDLALWQQLDRGEDPTDTANVSDDPARARPAPPPGPERR